MEQIVKKIGWYSFITMIIVVLIFVVALFNKGTLVEQNLGGTGPGYKNASSTSFVTTAGEATILLPVNPGRGLAIIQNMTATVAYLAFHATSSPNTVPILGDKEFSIPLAASGGTYYITDTNRYIGQIIASSSAAVTLRVTEVR